MKRLLLPSLVLLSLVACATTPLPEDSYEKAAMQFVGVHKCGVNGLMPAETAEMGKRFLRSYVGSYTYDKSRLERRFKEAENTLDVTPQICNTLAMGIIGANGGSATPVAPVQNTLRTTNCSTYFGQTHCTTF